MVSSTVMPDDGTQQAAAALQASLGKTLLEYAEPNYRYQLDAGAKQDRVLAPKNVMARAAFERTAFERTLTEPNDSLYYAQWFLPNIHAPEAWQITEGDSTVRIGFIDTGVDLTHPDLIGQFAVDPLEDINHNGLFDPWPADSIGRDAHGNLVHGDLDGRDHNGNGYANDVIGYDFVDQESLNIGDWHGRGPLCAVPGDSARRAAFGQQGSIGCDQR